MPHGAETGRFSLGTRPFFPLDKPFWRIAESFREAVFDLLVFGFSFFILEKKAPKRGRLKLGCSRCHRWLRRKSDEHRDRREEETLSLAKEANRLAFEANSIARLEAASAARSSRYAMYAAIIAAVAIVIDNKEDIFKFFSF